MKKSDLKKYIKEEILSILNEDTEKEIEDTKELTQAVSDLAKAKEEAGLEEAEEKDYWADYTDIGIFYMERHGNIYKGKKQILSDKEYEELGKKIVDQLYKGDVGKAYDAIVRPQIDSATKRLADKGALQNPRYTDGTSVKEDEDKEPSKADLKKTKGLAKAKEELVLLTREMKSLAKKYSKAEGEEKEKIVADLKKKTKLKKELEAILDK